MALVAFEVRVAVPDAVLFELLLVFKTLPALAAHVIEVPGRFVERVQSMRADHVLPERGDLIEHLLAFVALVSFGVFHRNFI